MSTDAAIVLGVRALWEQGHFQDFTIQAEDRSFKVHKLIMASVSDYFHAMLTGGMAESTKDTVNVGVVSALAMENLISFIYKDQMELTNGNVAEVLDAAMYLQIPTAVKVCADFMVKNVSPKNCCSLLSILKGYSLTDGVTEVKSFIASNVKRILNVCSVDHVPYEEFGFLMDNWQGSEMDLILSVNKWVDTDHGNRKQHLNDLLCKVRFCLMSPKELESIQHTEVYKMYPGSWQGLVGKALDYQKLPLHIRVLDDSEQSMLRSQPTLLCLYQDQDNPCGGALDGRKKWATLNLSLPEDCYMAVTALGVNNFLLVSPYAHGDGDWYVFDPRTLSWSQLAAVMKYKDKFAAVYHKGSLYVIGGSNSYDGDIVYDSIERYDFQTNQWSSFITLPNTREWHAACVFQDCIYVSGGRHDVDDDMLDKVDCLNIDTLKWESKAPMLMEAGEHFMCVMKLYGEEVILVVHQDFLFEYYNASSNQWTEFFFTHEQFPTDTSRCALFAKGNTVYFLDENEEGKWLNDGQCLEITFPEEGTDVSVTRLGHFMADSDLEEGLYFFQTHGAVLSLPDHKLPALNDRAS